MMVEPNGNAALVLVDFQKAVDDPKWGRRNNPQAEARAAELLRAWRATGRPVVHVQHLSRDPDSPYRPGQPGCDFKEALRPGPGEILVQKQINNAFVDTGLRSEEHTSELQSLMRISYAVFCLKKKNKKQTHIS